MDPKLAVQRCRNRCSTHPRPIGSRALLSPMSTAREEIGSPAQTRNRVRIVALCVQFIPHVYHAHSSCLTCTRAATAAQVLPPRHPFDTVLQWQGGIAWSRSLGCLDSSSVSSCAPGSAKSDTGLSESFRL